MVVVGGGVVGGGGGRGVRGVVEGVVGGWGGVGGGVGRGGVVVEYSADDREGKNFRLAVEDCGPGIRPEIMDKIFDPFFTTKDEGTGLGLAIVHRVVEAHEGIISASNREGGGARFEIRI